MAIDKDVFTYAWNWFEYHAGQRLVAFRYFLVFLGIIAVALNNAVKGPNLDIIQIISGLGSFISLAFLALEFRNEQLVNFGRDALKAIERDAAYPKIEDLKLLTKDRSRQWWHILLSHNLWIKLIYAVCLFGFFAISLCPSSLVPH